MTGIRFLPGLVMAAGILTASCAALSPAHAPLVLDYADSETPPVYQPGRRYLPLAQGSMLTWVVLAEQRPVKGTPQPLSIWYGQSDRLARTHGGKLVEIAGYAPALLKLADNCPFIGSLARYRPGECVRTFLTQRSGVYLSRVRVRQLPPEPVTYRLGGKMLTGSLVRESIAAPGREGNFYLYDAAGKYVMSRQWMDEHHFFDLFAAEQAE